MWCRLPHGLHLNQTLTNISNNLGFVFSCTNLCMLLTIGFSQALEAVPQHG